MTKGVVEAWAASAAKNKRSVRGDEEKSKRLGDGKRRMRKGKLK